MKFVKVKACSIPGFFSDSIFVLVEEKVPDVVLRNYALSLTWGGNFKNSEMAIMTKKMKVKIFNESKTDIPEKFYKQEGFSK